MGSYIAHSALFASIALELNEHLVISLGVPDLMVNNLSSNSRVVLVAILRFLELFGLLSMSQIQFLHISYSSSLLGYCVIKLLTGNGI